MRIHASNNLVFSLFPWRTGVPSQIALAICELDIMHALIHALSGGISFRGSPGNLRPCVSYFFRHSSHPLLPTSLAALGNILCSCIGTCQDGRSMLQAKFVTGTPQVMVKACGRCIKHNYWNLTGGATPVRQTEAEYNKRQHKTFGAQTAVQGMLGSLRWYLKRFIFSRGFSDKLFVTGLFRTR